MSKMYSLALTQYDEDGSSHVMMWLLANSLQYNEQIKICKEYLGVPDESFLTGEGLTKGLEAVEHEMVVYPGEGDTE